ncbi:hypothetical protein [Hamadaea tsunoensis]|uniref:hypothetical protein n=1 Tax=Hamadaea tsunoensis TaxID=53368 RepID=UPI0004017E4E|nr:hypothetical protein [Hamadaea tsunoensis]
MNRLSAPLSLPARIVRVIVLIGLLPAALLAWLALVPTKAAPLVAAFGAAPADRPTPAQCAPYRSPDRVPETGHDDAAARLRVFAIGYHLDLRHATSYDTWRTAMRCLIEDTVQPFRKPGVPTLVVFPEDIGLPTIAVGARGALLRTQAQTPLGAVSEDVPLGMATALAELNVAYAPQIAAYQAKFVGVDVRKQPFLAATDTFARAFSKTFSDIAKDYGIYVVASNNMAKYRVTHNPLEVSLYADPAVLPTNTAYVATDSRVTNTTFLWGPDDVNGSAPDFEHNLLFRNEKVPLTDTESTLLGLDAGPSTGAAGRANADGVTVAGFKLGFATSLPAFQYGYDFGQRPAGLDPCADLTVSYAACQDSLGVDVMIQADANNGRWTSTAASGAWQPLEWMGSTWRAVADPTVHFKYNVTPMMTGNLFDLLFDGQSAITGRGAQQPPRHYVGNSSLSGSDPSAYSIYAGDKTEFLALAPWADPDEGRDALTATGGDLAPASGSARENHYVEAVIYADLS